MYVCVYAVTVNASKVYKFSVMKLPFIALSVIRQIPSLFPMRVLHGVRSSASMTCFNPLTPELNPSAQRCLPKFFTGDFNF
jgi:hypothetical protein